jgi:predicted AlkP superfamily pyrophosphatase or phosphodiesterase
MARYSFSFVWITLVFLLSSAVEARSAKKNVVFWLSIDGFRADYIERTNTPNFDSLIQKSYFSKQLTPIFPSITFPSHASQATGVKVAEHGIASNAFYDSTLGAVFSYPSDSGLLQAEPIWQTVKRGGLRSAVVDWPLSYKQTGPFKADYFHDEYEGSLSDEERLERALKVWENGVPGSKENYDLVMAYIVGTDSAGHSYGPYDSRVLTIVEKLDVLIGKLRTRIIDIAQRKYGNNANIYLMITTDHGMIEVKHGVNIRLLANVAQSSGVRTITGGNVGHVFLDRVAPKERDKVIQAVRDQVKQYPFVTFYTKEELPSKWNFAHKTRVGDIVLILDTGYTFTGSATRPVVPISELGGPLGMHGYDPRIEANMQGFFMLYRYPEYPRGRTLRFAPHSLELHPTVAKILGVKPAAAAKEKPVRGIPYE